MTNRMNIDMGDFFGGGGPAEQQPVKKEPKSKFGFGLLSRAKSITASPITPKKGCTFHKQHGYRYVYPTNG